VSSDQSSQESATSLDNPQLVPGTVSGSQGALVAGIRRVCRALTSAHIGHRNRLRDVCGEDAVEWQPNQSPCCKRLFADGISDALTSASLIIESAFRGRENISLQAYERPASGVRLQARVCRRCLERMTSAPRRRRVWRLQREWSQPLECRRVPWRAVDDRRLTLRAFARRLQRGSEELSGDSTEVANYLQMSVNEVVDRSGFEPLTSAVQRPR
jgi:hypothetical protein